MSINLLISAYLTVSCTRGMLGSTEDSDQGAGVLQVGGEYF